MLLAGFLLLQVTLQPASARAPEITWELVAEHFHDSARFTQGFERIGARWLESSGGFGKSFVVLEGDCEEAISFELPADQFAEGVTFTGDAIWVLTWRAGIAYRLDDQLRVQQRVRYSGQGWGLAHHDGLLYMSDGSDVLQVRDAVSFELLRRLPVRDGMRRVPRLNELEYAFGLVWANVFGSDLVAAIDPEDGTVIGWLDATPLADRFDKPANWDKRDNVLNGIAVDPTTGHLHLTGKRWPKRFELRLDSEQFGNNR